MSLYNDALLGHAHAPDRATLPEHPTHTGRARNPMCGDEITVALVEEHGHIARLGFHADACAICIASASVLGGLLEGRSIDEVRTLQEALTATMNGQPGPERFSLFSGLEAYPSRHACALLPWKALEQALVSQPQPAPTSPRPHTTHTSPWTWAQAALDRGEQAAIATLISVDGSSPSPLGTRMAISSTGAFWGSVSGGCVESAIVQQALALMDGQPVEAITVYQISNSQAGAVGLPCGGRIEVHLALAVDPAAHEDARTRPELVSRIPLDGSPPSLVSRESLPLAVDTPTRLGDDFIDPLASPPTLILVGGTHVAQTLARLAREVGFEPILVDPRTHLANPERFGDIRILQDWPHRVLDDLIHPSAAVVMLTHDAKIDDPALQVALASDAFYVGALGSRKTQRARLERLTRAGIPPHQLQRLRGPAGLAIGATGAPEIALSILAEIVATRRARPRRSQIASVVLAAGSSRRAGPLNKLLAEVDGQAMVRRVVGAVLQASLGPCVVVLGHEPERVRDALHGLDVDFVLNPDHADGMSTSIGAGIRAAALTDVDAAFIVLGDMPFIRAEDLHRLGAAHQASTQHLIVAPEARDGEQVRLGNPVLWPRRYFRELTELRGDVGARSIMLRAPGAVFRVPIDHHGVIRDIDRPQDAG